MADLPTRYPTPAAVKTAGRGHVRARSKKHAPRAAQRLTDAILTVLSEQTVVVIGTSAAGIAPVTPRSGTSIRGEHTSRRGNKNLKRALFLSAFAALHHPPSRACYDRKHAEGKRRNQALIALARRRSDVLFARLSDGTLYQDP